MIAKTQTRSYRALLLVDLCLPRPNRQTPHNRILHLPNHQILARRNERQVIQALRLDFKIRFSIKYAVD